MTPFVKTKLYPIFKEKCAICQMVPFVTKNILNLIILVKAKGIVCYLCKIVTSVYKNVTSVYTNMLIYDISR